MSYKSLHVCSQRLQSARTTVARLDFAHLNILWQLPGGLVLNESLVSQKSVELVFPILQEKSRMGNVSSPRKTKNLTANIIYAHKT